MPEAKAGDKGPGNGGFPAGFFSWFPWEKITIWGLFLLTVYALRHFFFTIFMTFMLTYIMTNVVRRVMRVLSPETERTWLQRGVAVISFVLLIGLLYGVGTFLFNPLKEQAQALYNRIYALNVEGTLNELLRKTIGAWRYKTFYRDKPELEQKEREDFQKKYYSEAAVERFKKFNDEFNASFRESVVAQEGEKLVQELRDKGREKTDIKDWMFERNPEIERKFQEKKPDLIKEFERKGEEDWIRTVLGRRTMTPAEARELPEYGTKRDEYLKNQLVTVEYERDPKKYEKDFRDSLGQQEFDRQAREGRLEELQRKHFEQLEPKPPYTYDKFLALREARNESLDALERELRGGEPPLSPEQQAAKIREEFQRWKEAELAKEVVSKDLQFLQLENITRWGKERLPDLTARVAALGYEVISLLIQFVFSLLLSFFITFDLFKLRRGIHKLEQSNVRDFYREIAPGLISFGRLIGRSFQAQGVIAFFNTALTFILIKVLGIQNEVFLSSLVFLCSFIPVLGVVISSVPIAIMAVLQPGGGVVHDGLLLALIAIGGVLVVHFIETSILNPKIVGDMLHLHPVMVLGILAVAEYFFGVWGLLLGVPVAVYIFRCVILGEELDFVRPHHALAQPAGGPPRGDPPLLPPPPPPVKPAAPAQPVGAGPGGK
jgi:predicted PurR-regulated permease PerM